MMRFARRCRWRGSGTGSGPGATRSSGPAVDTLYLGGGTPSVLTVDELAALTGDVRQAFDLSLLRKPPWKPIQAPWIWPGCRRPGASAGIASAWVSRPWTTSCFDAWVASMMPKGLQALDEAREAGFQRISADLMIGIPGQDLSRVLADARRLVAAGASHLSIYMLDLDKACPLKVQVDAGQARAALRRRGGGYLRGPAGRAPEAGPHRRTRSATSPCRARFPPQHPVLGAPSLPGPGPQRREPPGPVAMDRKRGYPGLDPGRRTAPNSRS